MQKSEIVNKKTKVTPPKIQEDINLAAPGKLRVIKRNGKVVSFEEEKIKVAIMKAFLAVEGGSAAGSSRIHEEVDQMAQDIIRVFERRMPSGGTIHIEEIQDQVELQLMRNEHHKVARTYVLYREARKNERVEEKEEKGLEKNVQEVIESAVKKACIGLDNVDEILLVAEIKNATYEGISEKDLAESMLMTARTLVEKEPNYSYVTARLLLNNMENEVGAFLGIKERKDRGKMYVEALAKTIDKGIELDFLNEELKSYDL